MSQVISNFDQIENLPGYVDLQPTVTNQGTQRLFRERGPLVERITGIRTVLDRKPVMGRQTLGLHVLNGIDGYTQTPQIPLGRTTSFYNFATNGTNKAVFMWQIVGTTVYLVRSADGTGAWADVLSYTGHGASAAIQALPNIMSDVGQDRMIYVEYGDTGSGRIWASVDNGQNWGNNSPAFDNDQPLFDADWVKHFHGVVYDTVTDAIVIMLGDSNADSRMLYCDDIDDLFANPSVWKTRWGLDTDGQAVQRAYVLNDNLVDGLPADQSYRAVSADFTTVGGRRYVVWSMDAANAGGQFIWCQDITDGPTGSKQLIGPQIGANWIVKTLSNGTVIVAANSEANGIGNGSHDTYLRLYAVRPDLSAADIIHTARRSDFASPVGSAVWWFLGEVYGRMLAHTTYASTQDENTVLGFVGGAGDIFRSTEGLTFEEQQVVTAPVDKRNLISNGRFLVDVTGWDGAALTNATVARDAVNFPTGEIASLAITPTAAATTSAVTLAFTQLQRLHWGGQLWTIRFKYRINGALGTQNPRFFIQYGSSQSVLVTLVNTSGVWTEVIVTQPIPKNCTALQLWWYATYTLAETGVVLNIADVSVNLGTTINNRGVTP